MLRSQSKTQDFMAQLKLEALKKYIAAFLTSEYLEDKSNSAKFEQIKNNISVANFVGEIWCELFENGLFKFFNKLIKDFNDRSLKVQPSEEEFFFQRKKDRTHALHWLAQSENGFAILNKSDVVNGCISNFIECYGDEQVTFWHTLAKSDLGRKYIEGQFFGGSRCGRGYGHRFNADTFAKRSIVDKTHAWFWIAEKSELLIALMNGGRYTPEELNKNPPTKDLLKEQCNGYNTYEKFFIHFHNNKNTFLNAFSSS